MNIACPNCGHMNPADAQFCAAADCADRLWPDATPPHEPLLDDHRPQAERVRVAPQRGGLHVAVETGSLAVEPGESACTTILVRNTGTQNDTVTVTVEGSAREWASVEPETFSVLPKTEVEATVRFTPPHAPSSAAGPRWYSVRVTSGVHPGVVDTAEGTLAVGAFRGVDAELVPRETRARRRRTVHAVRVTNAGNVHEQVALEALDDDESLVFGLPVAEVAVAPGAVTTVDLQVRAPRRWVGRPRSHPFHVLASPQGALDSERLDGKRVAVPLLSMWMGIAAAAAVLATVAALVLPTTLFAAQPDPVPPPIPPPTSAPPVPGGDSGGAPSAPKVEPPKVEPPKETPKQPSVAAPAPKPAEVPAKPVASATVEPPPTTTPAPPTTTPPPPPPVVTPPPAPAPAPAPEAAPEPAPEPPVVVSTGLVEMATPSSVDLDRGVVPDPVEDGDLDLRAPADGVGALLAPREDAKLALGTVATGLPTPDLCQDRSPSSDPVRVADLKLGSVLCVVTDQGHLAVVRVDRLPATADETFAVTYATYEKSDA